MTIILDVRLEYLEGIVFFILKFKSDKWSRMIGMEENVVLFIEFFEKSEVSVLVMTFYFSGMIFFCLGFLASFKFKGVYFIKKKFENISKSDYKDRFIYGDISSVFVD